MEHLGKTIRDKATGIQGSCYCYVEYLSGMKQYGLQPKPKEGDVALPEMIVIDTNMLEVVDDGLKDLVIPTDMNTVYALGDKVKHKVTSFTGVVTSRYFYLNGCAHMYATAEKFGEKGKPDTYKDDTKLWDLVKSHKIEQPTGPKTGGPMSTMKR